MTASDDPSTKTAPAWSTSAKAFLDEGLRDGLAEEHDVRLHRVASADEAQRREERLDERVGQDDVAVRPHLLPPLRPDRRSLGSEPLHEARVRLGHAIVQALARGHLAARQADRPVERPVQLHDVPGARGLVQPVDVLGDDRPDVAVPLQLGDPLVPGVGLGCREPLPADVAAGPVAPSRLRRPGELAERHRLDAARSVGPAVVGDPESVDMPAPLRTRTPPPLTRSTRSSSVPRSSVTSGRVRVVASFTGHSLRRMRGMPQNHNPELCLRHDRCSRSPGDEGDRRRGKLHRRSQRSRLLPARDLADGPAPRAAHRHRARRALRPSGPPHRGRPGARAPRGRRARRPRRRRGGDHRDRRAARRAGPAPGLPQLLRDPRPQGTCHPQAAAPGHHRHPDRGRAAASRSPHCAAATATSRWPSPTRAPTSASSRRT